MLCFVLFFFIFFYFVTSIFIKEKISLASYDEMPSRTSSELVLLVGVFRSIGPTQAHNLRDFLAEAKYDIVVKANNYEKVLSHMKPTKHTPP
ncbi:hypothetical protein LguiA_036363 [Lonicera macranthoides]